MDSKIATKPLISIEESKGVDQADFKHSLAKVSEALERLVADSKVMTERLASVQESADAGAPAGGAVSQVASALESLSSDFVRLRTEIGRYIRGIQKSGGGDLSASSVGVSEEAAQIDSVTGVSNREGAERKLRTRLERNRAICVAVIIVERLPLINGRFGHAAGDKVLLTVSQHLASSLPPHSLLARWSGPAFMAIFELSGSAADLESNIQRSAGARLHQEIRTGERDVLMPISCSMQAYRVAEDDSAEAIFQRLDAAVAARTMPIG